MYHLGISYISSNFFLCFLPKALQNSLRSSASAVKKNENKLLESETSKLYHVVAVAIAVVVALW